MATPTRLFVTTIALVVGASLSSSAETAPAVVDMLFVGPGAREIAVNPLTGEVFVVTHRSPVVTLIDTRHDNAIGFIPLRPPQGGIPLFPIFAEDVTLDCLTNQIYVVATEMLHPSPQGLIVVIDGDTHRVRHGGYVWMGCPQPAVNPFTNRLYCMAADRSGVVVFDAESQAVFTFGPPCRSIALDPIANSVYTLDSDDWVMCFDSEDQPCMEPVRVSGGARLVVDPATSRVYVTQVPENQLTVIDGVTRQSAAVPVGQLPVDLAVNPLTGRVYVANYGDSSVSVIDGDTVVATVEVGRPPMNVAVNPLTGLIYVASFDGRVSVIEDLDPAFPPQRNLADRITNLMVEAGGAGNRLQEALAYIEAGAYEKAVHSLLAFSEEIQSQTLSPAHGEKLAIAARKIIMMMIGN